MQTCTHDFVTEVCLQLGHPEGAPAAVRILVGRHWLDHVEHLMGIPQERLERMGLPLRLAHAIHEQLENRQVEDIEHSFSAVVNYTMIPTALKMTSYGKAGIKALASEDIKDRTTFVKVVVFLSLPNLAKIHCHFRNRTNYSLFKLNYSLFKLNSFFPLTP